jgi:hypothetical protein
MKSELQPNFNKNEGQHRNSPWRTFIIKNLKALFLPYKAKRESWSYFIENVSKNCHSILRCAYRFVVVAAPRIVSNGKFTPESSTIAILLPEFAPVATKNANPHLKLKQLFNLRLHLLEDEFYISILISFVYK